MLDETWFEVSQRFPYTSISASQIADGLDGLTHFESRESFIRQLEREHRFPYGTCGFEKQKLRRKNMSEDVDCLVIRAPDALADSTVATEIAQRWMAFEDLPSYRVKAEPSGRILFYDSQKQLGLFLPGVGARSVDLGTFSRLPSKWDEQLSTLHRLAAKVDADLDLVVPQAG
jgi:hypothetical protein